MSENITTHSLKMETFTSSEKLQKIALRRYVTIFVLFYKIFFYFFLYVGELYILIDLFGDAMNK